MNGLKRLKLVKKAGELQDSLCAEHKYDGYQIHNRYHHRPQENRNSPLSLDIVGADPIKFSSWGSTIRSPGRVECRYPLRRLEMGSCGQVTIGR